MDVHHNARTKPTVEKTLSVGLRARQRARRVRDEIRIGESNHQQVARGIARTGGRDCKIGRVCASEYRGKATAPGARVERLRRHRWTVADIAAHV